MGDSLADERNRDSALLDEAEQMHVRLAVVSMNAGVGGSCDSLPV